MRELYPALAPASSGLLEVGGGHAIYWERCGAPSGIPVVFLHGGPGSGCKADHRQFFDPARYDVVLPDQRGAGRSTPCGEVQGNDTPSLVSDLELLRGHLGIDRWVLFGGSWGATLALSYAQAHPDRVLGMVLRGSFLARERDVAWFFGEGANRLLPVQWARFLERVGEAPDGDMVSHLHAAMFSGDQARAEEVARAWEAWSGAVVMFSIDQLSGEAEGPLDAAVAKARIEMHYARHRYFMDENALVAGADRLPDVPVRIVHGARDLTCPAEAAWTLHEAIPGSTLEIARTAGHLSGEKAMIDALVRASDELARTLSGG